MKNLLLVGLLCFIGTIQAQTEFFTKADTLRGMLRPERTCYDVNFYNLDIEIDPIQKSIQGFNEIHFTAQADFQVMQIDLFENMQISSIYFKNRKLSYDRVSDAVFIHFPKVKKGTKGYVTIHYHGIPLEAKNAPWDGGFVWKQSKSKQPWIGVACEGTGASLWWPNKDHLSDEPDSMAINITVPNALSCVSNGVLRKKVVVDENKTKFKWFVSYPINNYNVTVNIAAYKHFSDTYISNDNETLNLDYYVLPEHYGKAVKQFKQVESVLRCYEKYFGKYPFWNDGFALVETPYLGMEHQGAIAYGNKYKKGHLGNSPLNMDWDYIIVHESGHEYWGNSISCNDHAEMWIHESFTTYMEALYVEFLYDYPKSIAYLKTQKGHIGNVTPLVGPMDVNYDGWVGSDIYYKGTWFLHTLRTVFNDDEKWFRFLKSFYQEHKHSHIVTEDFVKAANDQISLDLRPVFHHYLYKAEIPVLEYKLKKKRKGLVVTYKWANVSDDFVMPIKIGDPNNYQSITPKTTDQTIYIKNLKKCNFKVADELFLIDKNEIKK